MAIPAPVLPVRPSKGQEEALAASAAEVVGRCSAGEEPSAAVAGVAALPARRRCSWAAESAASASQRREQAAAVLRGVATTGVRRVRVSIITSRNRNIRASTRANLTSEPYFQACYSEVRPLGDRASQELSPVGR